MRNTSTAILLVASIAFNGCAKHEPPPVEPPEPNVDQKEEKIDRPNKYKPPRLHKGLDQYKDQPKPRTLYA